MQIAPDGACLEASRQAGEINAKLEIVVNYLSDKSGVLTKIARDVDGLDDKAFYALIILIVIFGGGPKMWEWIQGKLKV